MVSPMYHTVSVSISVSGATWIDIWPFLQSLASAYVISMLDRTGADCSLLSEQTFKGSIRASLTSRTCSARLTRKGIFSSSHTSALLR